MDTDAISGQFQPPQLRKLRSRALKVELIVEPSFPIAGKLLNTPAGGGGSCQRVAGLSMLDFSPRMFRTSSRAQRLKFREMIKLQGRFC
ncbi:hypothetical protein Prudu_009155 [Prunus dulcis]|uniref:Uncharacterized protein n=1 Tax=Prunus dulcis TaxID=3755 RepID=A0A4Y1R5P4_PRUDU|nr:hypothetical protein Prudu_009155 [Prunus dulcis]